MSVAARSAGVIPVTAAVVNYNTRAHLVRCLASLAHEHEPIAEVIVIDNASTDGSVAAVEQGFPYAQLIANDRNVGYGAAANQAIRSSVCPYVLILNADTEVRPGAVEALYRHMLVNERTAVAAPALQDAHGERQPSSFPFPGTVAWLLENEPLSWFGRALPFVREKTVTFRTETTPRAVPWVLGAAIMVRREPVLEIGGFDESYFMYYEEVDLCQRLADAGWETHYVPEPVVLHVGGASTSQVRTEMLVQHFESTLRYYRRYYRGVRLRFWVGAMRLKMLSLLARDAVLLGVANDETERKKRREQIEGWRRSLFSPGPEHVNGSAPR